MQNKNQRKAYIFALAAVLLWSTVATAFKLALAHIDFIQLLFYSVSTAFVISFLILSIEGKAANLLELKWKHIGQAALMGFLNPFLYYLILFKAYDLLAAQEAMALNYTWPVMLVLLSAPLLKQKIHLRGFIAIIISFIGVLIIASHGELLNMNFESPIGTSLALGSSIVWALFWIANLRSHMDESLKLTLSFGFGMLYIIPLVYLFSDFKIPSIAITPTIYVGIAEMGLTFFLWLKALSLSSRTDKVSKLIFLSPFLSLVFISFILDEKIGLSTIIGLIFIIIGIAIKDKAKEARS